MMNRPNRQAVQMFCKERVYQWQRFPDLEAEAEKPWRPMSWDTKKRMEYMLYIKKYTPINSFVPKARVLLLGPIGAGKSSFFNSVNSVFRGHVTSQAISGSSATSVTTQFRTYSLKAGCERVPLPLILCDTMGLEAYGEPQHYMADIVSILKGHVPDCYQFQPSSPMSPDTPGFVKSPALEDRIHCVAYVIDASTVSTTYWLPDDELKTIRQTVNNLGIPQLVLMTKVDEACESVAKDIRNVYRSDDIRKKVRTLLVSTQDLMNSTMLTQNCGSSSEADVNPPPPPPPQIKTVSTQLGVPISCIIPVKNYSQELELDLHCDILLLSAVVQMLRYTDNYLDDFSERLHAV